MWRPAVMSMTSVAKSAVDDEVADRRRESGGRRRGPVVRMLAMMSPSVEVMRVTAPEEMISPVR